MYCAARRGLQGMNLTFALEAAINGSTGPRATLGYELISIKK